MSAALARLRKHFGDPLLVRDGRSLVRTPLGESLLGPTRETFAAAEMVFGAKLTFEPQSGQRTFTVIASDYVLVVLLRRLIAALAAEAPRVQLFVIPVTADYPDQLRRGHVDMAILPAEATGAGFEFPGASLFSDQYVVIADRNNSTIGDVITVEEFTATPSVTFDSKHVGGHSHRSPMHN